jgi:hypothetical protein
MQLGQDCFDCRNPTYFQQFYLFGFLSCCPWLVSPMGALPGWRRQSSKLFVQAAASEGRKLGEGTFQKM